MAIRQTAVQGEEGLGVDTVTYDLRELLLAVVLGVVFGGSSMFAFISWVFGGELDDENHDDL